uniref:Uncharacterized protein n=1 Tax=Heliconius erato TaxID=33431 RepID=A0A142LSZ6_HELEA|nr:hypothetical protein [Heliconius erato]
MDTRVFRGSDLGTDHYLVVARIRGLFAGWRSYTRCPDLESNYRIRSWKLQDPPTRQGYQERVSKKLDSSESGNGNIEVCWQNLRDCMKEAAIEVCGKGKRGFSKKRDEWWDDEVQDAVERKKKAWQDYKASGKDKSMRAIKKKEYQLQKHQTKVLIKMKREKAENERDERLTNNFKENTKLFWREFKITI